jgi:phosphatidylglycerol:prolipoprotein diacylglycerol transferase
VLKHYARGLPAGAAPLKMIKPLFPFEFFGLPIYNICAAIGAFAALLVLIKTEKREKCDVYIEEKINISAISAAAAALVFANLFNQFFFYERLSHLSFIDRLRQGGLTFYGGVIGFFAVFAAMLAIYKLDVKFWVNEIVPAAVIFHFFGRIGCSLQGCCYGVSLSPPFRIFGGVITLFPAREIEAAFLLSLFLIFTFFIKKHRFIIYIITYAVFRFFIEFGRGDLRGRFLVDFLSPAQVISILLLIGVLVYSIIVYTKRKVDFSKEK